MSGVSSPAPHRHGLWMAAGSWRSCFGAEHNSLPLAPGRLEVLCFVFLQHLPL